MLTLLLVIDEYIIIPIHQYYVWWKRYILEAIFLYLIDFGYTW